MENRIGISNEGFQDDRFSNIELKEQNKTENVHHEENQIEDCGFCINLKAFNRLRSPKWFLFFLSLGAVMQERDHIFYTIRPPERKTISNPQIFSGEYSRNA